jgi:Mg-chelatase subunit ChlD
VFGKKISEGQQLLEDRFETEDKPPSARFDLSKVLSRSRWLGRRKGIKGEGRPVAYRAFDQRARGDVSLSTSLRFAALRGLPLRILRDDLKANVREGRIKASLIFVLDTSESMIDSLSRVRDAIRSIRKTASRMRDRVGLVVFKGEDAQVIQHPSTNFNLVLMKLGRVGLSDFTPLSVGMYRGIRLAHIEQARGYSPIFVIASDGVTNVSTARLASSIVDVPDPATDSLMMANMIANKKWRAIVANMAHAVEGSPIDLIMGTQLMIEIAKVTRGIYVGFPQKEGKPVILDMSRGRSGEPIITSIVDSILP